MLVSLMIHNKFVSDVCMGDIDEIKYHLQHLHLEQYFIQQKYDQNCRHLCYQYYVFTSIFIYSLVQE